MINLGGCGEFVFALEASLGKSVEVLIVQAVVWMEAKDLVDVGLRLLCRRDLDRCGG